MKTYILEAPLTPPKDASDAPERFAALIKACSEIIADGKITAEEAAALRRWLQAAGWLKKFWPANAIAARINRLLEPLPTPEQLCDLGSFLGQVTEAQTVADSYEDCDEDDAKRPKLFDDPVPEIVFPGRKFCLSGIFYYGYRAECENAITERGGILRRAMSGSTHYLIVGGICNPQWKQAEAGTKIDSAVAFRSENTQWNIDLPRQPRIVPAIVRERDWVEALNGT
jgi:NAD-dependent DNA ligase